MPVKHFVEVGRVALVSHGEDAGKTCTIVDVVDQNRALVDGPNIRRQPISFKRIRLTRFKVKIPHGTSTKTIAKAWTKEEIDKKFAETKLAKRLAANEKKKNLTDFDRFKLYKTKQRMNKLIQAKFERLRAKAKREAPKPQKTEKSKDKPKKKKTEKKDKKK